MRSMHAFAGTCLLITSLLPKKNEPMKRTLLICLSFAILTTVPVHRAALGQGSGAPITSTDVNSSVGFPADLPASYSHAELCNYAWRLFIAANQTAGETRGTPAANSSFANSGTKSTSAPLVWETLYHRAEAYPYYDPSAGVGSKPKPSSSTATKPKYHFRPASTSEYTFPQQVFTGEFVALDENNQIAQNMLFFPKGSQPDYPTYDHETKDSQVMYMAKVNVIELSFVLPLPQNAPSPFYFPAGTLEVKSAWRLAADVPNQGRYHIANATYFSVVNGKLVPTTDRFALLALHIIVKPAGSQNKEPFVFCTFEQIDAIENSSGQATNAYYVPNYDTVTYYDAVTFPPGTVMNKAQNQNPMLTYLGAYDTIKPSGTATDVLSTTGQGSIPALPTGSVSKHTKVFQPKTISADAVAANRSVYKLLPPKSVWRNYALKGAQSIVTNSTGTGSARKGDPKSLDYYLANIVVESSQPGIQLFQGGPPGPSNNTLTPNLTSKNVTAADGFKVTIGGCMGCHGVAQQSGTDFSFLVGGLGRTATATQSARIPGFSPEPLLEEATLNSIRTGIGNSPRAVAGK